MDQRNRILVTAATGSIGRHVVSELSSAGATVRAMARQPDPDAVPWGVEAVHGDFTDLASVTRALNDVDSVFLLWPFPVARTAPAVVDLVAKHAKRVVYVSAMSVRDDQDPAADGVWGQVEQRIQKSGVAWTFLRVGGLATNTLGWADQIRADGVVRWPFGRAARSLIHERDVAAVAARALMEDGHAGAKYVLTGPAVLTQAEQVRVIGDAIGRPVHWEDVPPEQACEFLLTAWGDAGFVDGALRYWATLEADPEPVTHTVERVTGRPARTFREWASDHAEEFRS
jgi:uncharacterized protein YbjT (DUF2867 family)